jgi:ankyrin repeat protein
MSGIQSSNDELVEELAEFCHSDSLSEDGLRDIIERYDWNNIHVENYDFIIWACQNVRVTEGILRCLFEYFPDAAGATHSTGVTPLHAICYNKNATRGMVQLVNDAYPESLRKANNDGGGTPLHMLCINKDIDDSTAVDILGLLLERCPGAAQLALTNGSGALPIHIAAAQGSKSPEFCRMLIEAYPGSERMAASGGAHPLPFHCACRHGTVETVQYLLRLYPESINATNRDGTYPVQYAIKGLDERTNPAIAAEMVQFLVDCHSNVALQKIYGRFPLDIVFAYACNNRNNASIFNAAVKILHLLYDAHPEVIEDKGITSNIDRRDIFIPREVLTFINTQLTYARQARSYTVRQMKKRDENGQVPLHRALRDNAPLGSIKLLVKRNPSAVLTPDNSDALPLHVAIQHYDATKVVDYLIRLDSGTLTAVDREGNTALHLACHGAKYDIIALLLEKYDAVSVSQGNVLNKLPIHLLFESDATASRADDTKYLESVFQLLRSYPETVMVSEDAKQASIPQGGRPSRSGKKRKYRA